MTQFSSGTKVGAQVATLQKEIKKAYFSCKSSICPEEVGMIYFNLNKYSYKTPSIGLCTGFLISPNIVATNSHCIPDDIKESKNEYLCQDRIAIRFLPSKNEDKTIFNCKRIIKFSPVVGLKQDYAFFEIIENSLRKPLKISKNGAEDSERIYVQSVSPVKVPSLGGELTTSECQNIRGSFLSPNSVARFSKVGLAIGCPTVHGNSGSPVFNQNSEVIGILQSQFSDDYKYDLESRLSPLGITNLDNIPNHFQYTNFACVLDPIYQVIDEKCEATDSLSITSCKRSELTSALDNEAKQAFEAWRTTLPKIFKYRFVFSPKKMHYTADPVCVLTNEQDKKAYDSYVTKSGTYGFRSEVISVVLQEILTLSSQLKIDDFYRIKRWDLETKFLNPLSIDLKSSGDYWIGTSALQKTISGNTTFDLLFADKSPLQLKKCSESEYLSQEKTLIFYEGQLIPEDQYQSENKKPEMNPELCR